MIDMTQLLPMMPELLICGSAVLLLLLGAFRGNGSAQLVNFLACVALVGAAYLLVSLPDGTVVVMNGMFRSDDFTRFSKGLILVGGLLALILSDRWLVSPENKRFEYPILVLFSILGLMLLVSADNLMSLYMALELASLCMYVLAAIDRDLARSSEAGLKYFVLGSVASGLMLFGSSLVYGFSGVTSFASLAQFFASFDATGPSYGLIVGLVLIMAGLCFKVSAVPFHMWAPDVYEGAPTPVVTFFASVPKVAVLCLFARFLMQPFAELIGQWQQIILFVSIASMIVGAFGALLQTNIKRLLAYSSIGHAGYALVGLASATESGVQAMLIYLSLYLFMTIGAFGFVQTMRRDGKPVETIDSLAGLSKNNPRAALLMAIMMFSMAGIPPLAGFFGKMYVFLSAVEAGLYPLVIIGLLSSVVAAYYYLKVVKVMYFDEADSPFDRIESLSSRLVLLICAVIISGFFIVPTPLIQIADLAARALTM